MILHDDVIKWKHFPRYWPFARGIHRSPVNSPHKGQWRGALMFSLNWAWINGWINNREAGDLRRYRAHYDVIVMNDLHTHITTAEEAVNLFSKVRYYFQSHCLNECWLIFNWTSSSNPRWNVNQNTIIGIFLNIVYNISAIVSGPCVNPITIDTEQMLFPCDSFNFTVSINPEWSSYNTSLQGQSKCCMGNDMNVLLVTLFQKRPISHRSSSHSPNIDLLVIVMYYNGQSV